MVHRLYNGTSKRRVLYKISNQSRGNTGIVSVFNKQYAKYLNLAIEWVGVSRFSAEVSFCGSCQFLCLYINLSRFYFSESGIFQPNIHVLLNA